MKDEEMLKIVEIRADREENLMRGIHKATLGVRIDSIELLERIIIDLIGVTHYEIQDHIPDLLLRMSIEGRE